MKSDATDDKLIAAVLEELKGSGINLDELCCGPGDDAPKIKAVCVRADLGESLRALGGSTRDQVVMVRVDKDTCSRLDQWVATGAARSRSEAAALFIREGLDVRRSEFEQLGKALGDLEKARKKLRREARKVLGEGLGHEQGE